MVSIISPDSSSPAFSASFPNFSTSSTSVTSPSFSPSGNNLLVVLASWTGSYSVSPSISDTLPGSYDHPVHYSSAIFGAASGVDIWTKFITAPGSTSVNVSWSGSEGFETVYMRVLVLDNCNSSQSGVASNRSHSGLGGSGSSEVSLAPNYTGSWIVAITAVTGNTGLTLTTVSNFTPLDFYHQASGDFEYGNADGANETGPSGSTTVGWSFNQSGVPNATGALEIAA
jgi:hypothetical protein